MTGPRVLRCSAPPTDELLAAVVAHLEAGGLIAYPTETVYGFGGLARPDALDALTTLKGRDPGKPFLVLVPSEDHVPGLTWSACARTLADRFWPGPLTLVLPDPDGSLPVEVTNDRGGVAVRVSSGPFVAALMGGLDKPITSTSANVPGGDAARSGTAAFAAARSLGAGEEVWVVDAGAAPGTPPSTIVECRDDRAVVLRSGAVSLERLREAWPEIDE